MHLFQRPFIFFKDIHNSVPDDIESKYDAFPIFFQGSDSQTLSKRDNVVDIDTINRWVEKEKAGGS